MGACYLENAKMYELGLRSGQPSNIHEIIQSWNLSPDLLNRVGDIQVAFGISLDVYLAIVAIGTANTLLATGLMAAGKDTTQTTKIEQTTRKIIGIGAITALFLTITDAETLQILPY